MPGQQGDRVLELGPRPFDRGRIRFGAAKRRLGLRDVLFGVDAGPEEGLGQPQRLLVVRDRLREERLQRVFAAQLEVGLGEGRLLAQRLVRERRGARLRGADVGLDRVPHLAEEIRLPGGAHRERQRVPGAGAADGAGCRRGARSAGRGRRGRRGRDGAVAAGRVGAGADRDGGEARRARGVDHRERRHVVRERLLDRLVVDNDLLFEGVQLGVAEQLPPFPSEHRVLRIGGAPAVRLRLGAAGLVLLVLRRSRLRQRRALVGRTDVAAAGGQRRDQKRSGDSACHRASSASRYGCLPGRSRRIHRRRRSSIR